MLCKLLDRAKENAAILSGRAREYFFAQKNKIRVLNYHNLVPDELAENSWVPSHCVTCAQFERQMDLVADLRLPAVPPLGEALNRIQNGMLTDTTTICLTFDDGTADNVTLALPILKKHGFRATFFLVTGNIDRREPLNNDVIRLLRNVYHTGRLNGPISPTCQKLLTEPDFNKNHSLFSYQSDLYDLWARNQTTIDPAALQAVRMMSWDDARKLRDAGMEIGAHTVDHVILAREQPEGRRYQISESVNRVRAELGGQNVPFAYPNGQAEDYGETDLELLKALAVPYAVTTLPGWNEPDTERLKLKRNSIGRHCNEQAFLAQVFGLRDPKQSPRTRQSA